MPEESRFAEGSPAVEAHMSITQSVIQRMAANSTSCKAWCIALVSAILVIVADKGKPIYALIAAIPTVLFLVLDAYYLALKRCFRDSYNAFIEKLHGGQIQACDLYVVTPRGSVVNSFGASLLSFSVCPFYLTLGVTIWIVKHVVIP